ncbi:hypothetical protein RF11_04931 [Thelohanellus kitauei]|uniref:Peptidase A2 domain-containing protein n=1 Tax=Thelohanellus kitauei TaxID=669202 RepID=A0A0C2N9I6_THEKT|nr:hypothetical protein RF11_04931 [Thelohanellus kitauei]
MATSTRITSRESWNSNKRQVYKIGRSGYDLINLPINIEGLPFPFLVDTGPSCSIINSSVIDALKLEEDRSVTGVVRSFGGNRIAIRGCLWADIAYNGRKHR